MHKQIVELTYLKKYLPNIEHVIYKKDFDFNLSTLLSKNFHLGYGIGLGFYESITCGTPVFTIDTPPNNEIIREGVNGWLVRCGYAQLNDNKEGIVLRATITVSDLKDKLYEIISTYNREEMLQSTIMDYVDRYPIDVYSEQIKKMFS